MSVFTNPASRAAGDAQAYVTAVLGLLGDRDPLVVLHDTRGALARSIYELSLEQLRAPERPGKWSIAAVLQHLADAEVVWAWRMRLILAQDRPPITGFDQDLWADRLHYHQASPADALDVFGVMRGANLRLLAQTPPADLDRVGLHAERGEESLRHMMKLYAGHDLLHLNQIERVRAVVERGDASARRRL
jgi:uncharacterized damage-inducible protein DinB